MTMTPLKVGWIINSKVFCNQLSVTFRLDFSCKLIAIMNVVLITKHELYLLLECIFNYFQLWKLVGFETQYKRIAVDFQSLLPWRKIQLCNLHYVF